MFCRIPFAFFQLFSAEISLLFAILFPKDVFRKLYLRLVKKLVFNGKLLRLFIVNGHRLLSVLDGKDNGHKENGHHTSGKAVVIKICPIIKNSNI